MTLQELENTLPNGLHDAEVRRISVDYGQQSLALDLDIWVGDMDDPPERREAYMTGRLEINGLVFLIFEPPVLNPRYPYRFDVKLTIDSVDGKKDVDPYLPASVPRDAFCHSFFVFQWNSCIHFAATHAEMIWLNDGQVTYRPRKELRAKS